MTPPADTQLLRLQLLVGMSASDDVVDEAEAAALRRLVADWAGDDSDARERLETRLEALLLDPPVLGTMLRQLVELEDRSIARALLDDLATLAHADGVVDPREEGMLRMVCGALELPPETLFDASERATADVGAADLARLVRALIGLE